MRSLRTPSCMLVLFSLISLAAAELDCLLPMSEDANTNAQKFAYALQNVSCPVNTAYNQLFTFHNASSVLDSSAAIIDTIQGTMPNLQSAGVIESADETDIWRGPAADIPFEFMMWADQLLAYHDEIVSKNLSAPLLASLMQQRDAAKSFIDLAVSKVDLTQRQDVQNEFAPVADDYSCAIAAFQPGASVTATACAGTSSPAPVSGDGLLTATASASASSGGAAAQTASGTGSSASPTSTRSAAGSASPPIKMILALVLDAWAAILLFL